ncbi:ubiquitin-conjugating enzyme/RWD-like protein [Kockovaella imperatae]|uniref:Ubiquitin-conjugating enzyme/RWD-like protein n=1 Tax=Kockovaella imperatae TaxID=4999 RepID=A0A1Y1UQ48_9TREE|nr:ubiquitin-conjugating enzyme/RWD-like protein [Kockovaella imperatae]ORX40161.1 ubiquitin-conjugating enzyme/RWD-like protein [Kockovaella imperatae]
MSTKRVGGASANSMAAKRIKREIADLSKENLGNITLVPNESNIFAWKATIPGPQGSPYEGGVFEVDIRIPDDYPFSPPHLHFITKVYHCNVASSGAICLDLLKTAWSPALSLYKVILSLSSLLTDPNPSDPLVPAIAQEYKKNKAKHDQNARDWVKQYALPKNPPPPTTSSSSKPNPMPAQRPHPISRPNSSTSVPPAQVAGTRRSNPFSSDDGQETSGRDTSLANGTGSASAAINLVDSDSDGEAGGTSSRPRRGERAPKRPRTGVVGAAVGSSRTRATASDDVIVIDD